MCCVLPLCHCADAAWDAQRNDLVRCFCVCSKQALVKALEGIKGGVAGWTEAIVIRTNAASKFVDKEKVKPVHSTWF